VEPGQGCAHEKPFPRNLRSRFRCSSINRNTGHRIKYQKVDADTGEEVSNEDIIKGYKVDTDRYLTS